MGIYDRDYMRPPRSTPRGDFSIRGSRTRWWVLLVMAVLWLLVWFYVIPLGKQQKPSRKPPKAPAERTFAFGQAEVADHTQRTTALFALSLDRAGPRHRAGKSALA